MSDHERFAHIAQRKLAIVSESLRSLSKNERMSDLLVFHSELELPLHALEPAGVMIPYRLKLMLSVHSELELPLHALEPAGVMIPYRLKRQ